LRRRGKCFHMGCSGSKLPVTSTSGGRLFTTQLYQLEVKRSRQEVVRRCQERITPQANKSMMVVFQNTKPGTGNLSRDEMRSLLPGMHEKSFDLIWSIFDPANTGSVDAQRYSAGVALLLHSGGGTLEERIEDTFAMFDVDGSGYLDRTELRTLIEATLLLNLRRMMDTGVGEGQWKMQLDKELSSENLMFWNAARKYREGLTYDERPPAAASMMEEFVRNGADMEINLPSLMKAKLVDEYHLACQLDHFPINLFADAENEILLLMERDSFSRFRQNEQCITAIVDGFLKKADKSHNHQVDFTEYREWIMNEPQILAAFCHLAETVSHVLSSIEPAERRSIEDAILDGTGGTVKAVEPRMHDLANTADHGKLDSTIEAKTEKSSSLTGSLQTV